MNTILRLALLAFVACFASSSVQAKQHAGTKHVSKTSLEQARSQLKELAKDIKDSKLQALIKDTLKKSGNAAKAKKSNPEMTKSALHAVKKLLTTLKQRKMKEEALSDHDPFTSSCSVCSKLSELESEVGSCCRHIQRELDEIDHKFPCNPSMTIDHVPIVINEPGKYCVTRDLNCINGCSNLGSSAILVTADNVTINFAGHSLTVPSDGVDGIQVTGNEFVLENDIIVGPSSNATTTSGAAVHLIGVQKATLNNVYTQNFYNGVQIEDGSENIHVENSLFQAHANAGVYASASNGIQIDTCTFDGQNIANVGNCGLYLTNSSQNVIVKDSSSTGWTYSVFCNAGVSTITIEDCLVVSSSGGDIVQLGDASTTADDVIIRNSVFSHSNSTGYGVTFLNGTGLLLENVIVDSSQQVGVLIGDESFGTSYSQIVGRNVNVRGTPQYGVWVQNGADITFDSSQFTGATSANVLIQPPSVRCSITNSQISGGAGNGLTIQGTSNSAAGGDGHAISNCRVVANQGTGISLDANTANDTISATHIQGNGSIGIDNYGRGNIFADCLVDGNAPVGIVLENGSSKNMVKNCTVTDTLGVFTSPIAAFSGEGIIDSGSSNSIIYCVVTNNASDGILIQSNTNVSENQVFANSGNGINYTNSSCDAAIYNNTSCNNNAQDCTYSYTVSCYPTVLPYDSFLAGYNLCCNARCTPAEE